MVEPVDARVRAEPRLLAPGEPAGRRDGVLDSLFGAEQPVEVRQRLAVSQRLCRGPALAQAGRIQPAYLVEQSRLPHLVHPGGDTGIELRPRDPQADRDGGQVVLAGRQGGRERSPGELDDLQCTNDPPPVPGLDGLRRNGIRPHEPGVQGLDALPGELVLEPGAHGRVGRRDLEPVQGRADIQPRAADQDRPVPPGPDAGQVEAGITLVCRDARLLANIEDVELMVGDPPPLVDRDLGRADVHAPIELHRIGIHDLTVESLGEAQGEIRLAAGCWSHDRYD